MRWDGASGPPSGVWGSFCGLVCNEAQDSGVVAGRLEFFECAVVVALAGIDDALEVDPFFAEVRGMIVYDSEAFFMSGFRSRKG
jgi:hypothetical protein